MQICLEYIDSACLPTVGIQNPGGAGAYSRNLVDRWCVKEESHVIKHIPSFSHGLFFFQEGTTSKKCANPRKKYANSRKSTLIRIFHFGNQGSTKFCGLMAYTQPNLPFLDRGVQETKKWRNVCRGDCEIKWSGNSVTPCNTLILHDSASMLVWTLLILLQFGDVLYQVQFNMISDIV